ncbi:hypothetical protein MPER_08826, partial [Moniliophthora perniciosa FA553]
YLYSLHANIFSARTQDAVSTLKIPPPHVIMLHAMYHFVVILLHRPFYSRNRFSRQSPLHDLAKVVHLIEITFTAGTIHLLGAVSHENSRSEKRFRAALAGARECVKALEEMGRAWQCATQSGQVLDNLIRDWCPQGTRVEGEARSAGEMILETGTQTPMNVNLQQTLQNPSSDLAKELLRLGTPTSNFRLSMSTHMAGHLRSYAHRPDIDHEIIDPPTTSIIVASTEPEDAHAAGFHQTKRQTCPLILTECPPG